MKMLLEHLLSNDYITQEQLNELEKIVCEDLEIETHRKRLLFLLNEIKDKDLLINELEKHQEQVKETYIIAVNTADLFLERDNIQEKTILNIGKLK